MEALPEFVQDNLRAAKVLLKNGAVKEPVFSRNTYQVEVQDTRKKKFFSFLQLQDDGEVFDSFCSCEKGQGCVHLAVAYLRIFNGLDKPLHVRFKKSLWNRLFQMASKRHGYDVGCLKRTKDGKYFAESKTKKRLFWIEAKHQSAKKKLESIVSARAIETEETSLKFSNWPIEEIASLRQGKGGHALKFELSFWSDLAKWLMYLQDEGKVYRIEYGGKLLPCEMTLKFPELNLWFYISEVSWPWLIPSLNTVESSLKVFESEAEGIEKVDYDPERKQLLIKHKGVRSSGESDSLGTPIGDWVFVEGKGFYRRRSSPLFHNEVIDQAQIAEILTANNKDLQSFLPIHPDPKKANYKLYFDKEGNFHVEFYILHPGDLKSEKSALFIPWVYVEGAGFYRIEDWIFNDKEKVIAKCDVADFVNRHRLWLHNFPGFQTHLGSVEAHLIYHVNEKDELSFEAELNFPEGFEEAIHFDEWVYLPGEGFYMKRESASKLPLHPGLCVSKDEISSFIASHREELEQVQGFFSSDAPLLRTGLEISLNEEGLIEVSPQRQYVPGVDCASIRMFGHYMFLKGKGFSEIPSASRLPEKYQERVVIPVSQEAAFLTYELEPLKSFIVEIDPRLKKPVNLKLKIRQIICDSKRKSAEWVVDLVYESESGAMGPIPIWDLFQSARRHCFSPAGLLSLKEPRFNWIRQLPKKRLDRKRGMIRLNTLEWMRLMVFEHLEPPLGNDPATIETRKLFDELNRLETHRLLNISQLKATLRPYQEQGLQWLWFLYCHGLSGLLCDDMGLGKTHQAMALLAAIANEDLEKRHKYLVVCPTSVIYHWEDLLKRFLPGVKVCVYYGLTRSLQNFETNYDLLLTSYGILRTGRDNFRGLTFETAIFDEIQIAKNYASQTHKALREIRAKMRLGLSGTPIENRLRELKALIDVVLPSYLPSDATFRELFIYPIEKQNDEEKKVLLGRLVKPFILRRKKSEVLTDLPEKIEEIAYCDLSSEQETLYLEIASMMRDTVYQELKDKEKPIPYMHVFAVFMNLKRICDHPALYLGNVKQYHEHTSGKWDLFVELLSEALGSGQKVVVFSQYIDMLRIIESYLRKKGIGFASITGATRDRNEQLKKFREDPSCSVFVASLLAAGVGIDLTVASIVIHYDRWWNPAKENQATDRVHRIGQSRGVQVFKLVTKNTIEEHIHQMIEKKKGLLESIIGAEDQITYLSREELLEVFDKMFKTGNSSA